MTYTLSGKEDVPLTQIISNIPPRLVKIYPALFA